MNKLVNIEPSKIILHPAHPATLLHADVRARLLPVEGCITSEHLIDLARIIPLTIFFSRKKSLLVAGWQLWSLLRLACIDKPVQCILLPKLSADTASELGLADMIYRPYLSSMDEISHRICAITSLRQAEKQGYVSRRQTQGIKTAYNLPTRKRNSLTKLLKDEPPAVQEFILNAPAPIGGQRDNSTDNADSISKCNFINWPHSRPVAELNQQSKQR